MDFDFNNVKLAGHFNIIIDGQSIHVKDDTLNLVEVAHKAGIVIPAPCYKAKKKNGCCMACVVEIEGIQQYACVTTPTKGMDVIFNRDDLKALRKQRILKYKAAIKNQKPLGCGEID